MTKIIEFYIPTSFKRVAWIPARGRGKVVKFPVQEEKSA
jgi:hypothetical protein